MHNSKLFKVLRSLSNQEWISLKKYIDKDSLSPQVKQLFAYLFQRKAKLDSKVMSIDYVRTKYFENMTKKNFQNMMSKLGTATEDFLILKHLKEDRYEWEVRRFQVYNDRNIYGLADKQAAILIDGWSKSEPLDFNLFTYLTRIYHTQFLSENPIKYKKGNTILKELIITLNNMNLVMSDYYDFILENALSISLVENKELSIDPILSDSLSSKLLPIISNLRKLSDQDNSLREVAFDYLFDVLVSDSSISKELKTVIYELCDQYLRHKISQENNKRELLKLFQLFDFGTQQGLVLYNNAMSRYKFQNIIAIACILEKFDWVTNFIKNNINFLPELEKKENMKFAEIQILFCQNEFDEIISIINSSSFNLFGLKLQSRWYLISCYFITFDKIDFINAQINGFIQFLYYNEKRISKKIYEGVLNLAKLYKSAIHFSSEVDLHLEIQKYDNIVFRHRLPSIFKQRKLYIKKHNIQVY